MDRAPVAAVVVAYRSDPQRLSRVLGLLAPQVDTLILVDNSDTDADRARVGAAAAGLPVRLVAIGRNAGIAAAQNRGIAAALQSGACLVLLSDDDSQPPADLVARLRDGLQRARALDRPVAAVGPMAYDERDPASTLVFGDTRYGPRRLRPEPGRALLPTAFLLASGCLIDAAALQAVGAMREDLFIDHVDLEWGLRAHRAGWSTYAIADLPMAHRLGERLLRLRWLGGRRVHVHPPLRNYYLVRNTVLLLRGPLMSAGWRWGYLWWLARYAAFNAMFVGPRLRRTRLMLRALADGVRGRAGPLSL